MKNKDVIALLKKEASKIEVPNYNKEDILNRVDFNKQTPITPKKRRSYRLVPILSGAGLTLVVALLIIFFSLRGIKTPTPPNNNFTSSVSEIYAKQLTSLVSVSDSSANKLPMAFKSSIKSTKEDALVNEINPYMLTIDSIFNESKLTYELFENDNTSFNYENKLVVSYLNKEIYTMYYTETPYKEYDDDIDLDEINTKLSGVLVDNNHEYRVEGYKEVENDESEFEMELHYSSNSYLKVSQEVEVDENDYEYELYENGRKVKEVAIECDYENKSIYLEMNENEYEMRYSNNQYTIAKSKLMITLNEDTIIYSFRSGTIIEKKFFE